MFHTSISGSGCDCDESAPNPDELCALDEKCKQCKCIPEGEGKTLYKLLSRKMHAFLSPAGCDCDETSPNPDELCPGDYKCNKCKCLPPGQLPSFNCEAQGKGRTKGRLRKVTQRSFIDCRLSISISLKLYTKFG